MYAAMNDNLEAVQHLIENANADPNKVCKEGMTAIMYAVNNPQSAVLIYLMECEKVNLSLKSPVSTVFYSSPFSLNPRVS